MDKCPYEIKDSSFSPRPLAPFLFVCHAVKQTEFIHCGLTYCKGHQGQAALCLSAGVGLNVFNVSFYLCKSAPIHGDLTVSLNSLGDEVSVLVQLKQTLWQTIGRGLLLH